MTHDAFISYSRKDKVFAARLEKALEAYVPPKELGLPRRHLDVFRDEEDFTGNEYYQSLDRHLHDATKLIVLCSPAARSSQFVNDEIRRFAQTKGPENIIALLVAGMPNNEAGSAQSDQMAFPDAMCGVMAMPLAVDYRDFDQKGSKINRGRYESSWYTTLANIYGISRAEIEQRDRKRRFRRRGIAWVIATILAAVFVLFLMQLRSKTQVIDWQGKKDAARILAEYAEKAADLEPRRGLRIGSLLAAESMRVLVTQKGYAAWQKAVSQMPRITADVKTDSVGIAFAFTPDARKLVVLCGERHVHVFSVPDLRQLREVQAEQLSFRLAMSPAGDKVVLYSQPCDFIEIIDIDSGNKHFVLLPEELFNLYSPPAFDSMGNLIMVSTPGIWTVDSTTRTVRQRVPFPPDTRGAALSPDAAMAVARTDEGLIAFNVQDGSVRWRIRYPTADKYDEMLISGDSRAVIAISPHYHSILSAATGLVLNTTPVARSSGAPHIVAAGDVYVRGAQLYKTSGGKPLNMPFVNIKRELQRRLPAVSPSGRYVAGFSKENPEIFSVFDTTLSGLERRSSSAFHITLDEGQRAVGAVFSADSQFLAVSSGENFLGGNLQSNKIQIVSLAQDRWCPTTPESLFFPSSLGFNYAILPPDGRVVVMDRKNGSMSVYDPGGTRLWQTGETENTWGELVVSPGLNLGELVVSPSGRFVARTLRGTEWIVTDMATKQNISIRDKGPLAFAPDENRVLISSRIHQLDYKSAPQTIPNTNNFFRLWFLSGTNLVIAWALDKNGHLAGHLLFDWRTKAVSDIPKGSAFAISPDARTCAVSHQDVVEILKIGAKKPSVRSKQGVYFSDDGYYPEQFLVFNREGTLLAAASQGGINLYDARTLEMKIKVPLLNGDHFAGFSRDGKYILSYRWQNGFPEPTFHPITFDGVIKETCAKAKRNLTPEEWSRYAPLATPQNTCP